MAIENLLLYFKYDLNNKLTVSATRVTGEDVDQDETVYLRMDYGASHFDELDIDFEFMIAGTSIEDCLGAMALANTTQTIKHFEATDCWIHVYEGTGPSWACRIVRGYFVAYSTPLAINSDQTYYATLSRAAGNDTVTFDVYTDAERLNLLGSKSVSGFGTVTWQYINALVNRYVPASGLDFDGYFQNFDLGPSATTTSSSTTTLTSTSTTTSSSTSTSTTSTSISTSSTTSTSTSSTSTSTSTTSSSSTSTSITTTSTSTSTTSSTSTSTSTTTTLAPGSGIQVSSFGSIISTGVLEVDHLP